MNRKEETLQLIQLTRLYLHQRFSKNEKISQSDKETYTYFNKWMTPPSIPQKSPPPPKAFASPPPPPLPIPPPIIPKAVLPTPMAVPPPKKIEEKKGFELEKPAMANPLPFKEYKELLGHLGIVENIPKPFPKASFTEVLILLNPLQPAEEELLKKISEAIQNKLNHSCSLLFLSFADQNQLWDSLFQSREVRWILGTGQLLHHPVIVKHFKESPKEGRCFLGNIPFLMLADISLYLKEPALKASLWKALCQLLKK